VQQEIDATFGSGEMRHYRETIEPVRDDTGKVVGLIGAATDITEQHRMRQQLTEELGFRERMMGVLSHDLRNPLSTVGVAAELMLRSRSLPETERNQALRIRRSAGRMGEMIDTLLDFTRMRFLGQVALSPKPTDLGEVARDAIDEIHVAWPDRTIELDVHGDPHGEWDPARISQTVFNLANNAITYGSAEAPVRISIEGVDGQVALKVHNSGPPISPALIPTIFEPFRRGLDDRSPQGLGLGLYIAEQIVHAHHGTISVESTGEDGTTFTVRLPRTEAAAAP
jgi:signal transduction histidine kinase